MIGPTKTPQPQVPLNLPVTPAEFQGDYSRSLLRLCNITMERELTAIWNTVPPLKNYYAQVSIKLPCRHTANILRLWVPSTLHSISVEVLDTAFYTKDADGVGDLVNIFLFLCMCPWEGLNEVILKC